MTEESTFSTPPQKPFLKRMGAYLLVVLLLANLIYLAALVQKSQQISASARSLLFSRNREAAHEDLLEPVIWNSRCQADEICQGGLVCKQSLDSEEGFCCTQDQCAIRGGCVIDSTLAVLAGEPVVCESGEWIFSD